MTVWELQSLHPVGYGRKGVKRLANVIGTGVESRHAATFGKDKFHKVCERRPVPCPYLQLQRSRMRLNFT